MDPRTQPLRDDHRALLPELAMLRVAADSIGTPGAAEHVSRAQRLLARYLVPHMDAEEAVLYPAIDRCAGRDATETLRRDHDAIRRCAERIDDVVLHPTAQHDNELRAALYGLDALVHLHLSTEEELFYPILDEHAGEAAALELVVAMHRARRDE